MLSAVLLPLLLAVQAAPSDPAVRLDVWPRSFVRYGEPIEVVVRPARDGFLAVLRVDTYGRVHVLFPLDPTDDVFVRAGESLRLYGRYGNTAFAAFERDGEGTVLAAVSDDPYDFGDFTSGRRWSYSLMGVRYAGSDHVGSLLQLVEHMAGSDRFEYAVATYWVSTRIRPFYSSGFFNASCFGLRGFGNLGPFFWGGYPRWGWHYDAYYYDPFHAYHPFDPFWYDDLFYSPYGCYTGPYVFLGPVRGGTVIVPGRPGVPVDRGFKKKKGDSVKPFEPRRREPGAGSAVTIGRQIDLRPVKPERQRDEWISDPTWRERGRPLVGRDRSLDRPSAPEIRMPEGPRVRDRDVPKRHREPTVQRPQPMRPERPSTPVRSQPAAQKPAQKPAEKPKN